MIFKTMNANSLVIPDAAYAANDELDQLAQEVANRSRAPPVTPDGSDGEEESSDGEEEAPDRADSNEEADEDEQEVDKGVAMMHIEEETIVRPPPVVRQPRMKLEGVVLPAVTKLQRAAAVEAPKAPKPLTVSSCIPSFIFGGSDV